MAKKIRAKLSHNKSKNMAKAKSNAFKAVLSGELVISGAIEAKNLYGQSRFGEIINNKVCYSLVEALYLIERNKMNVYLGTKKLSFNTFMEQAAKREENFHTRYLVYKDLRNRGNIVKTALKYGADFRVYAKGTKPGQEHAKWIVFPVYENSSLTWQEFAAKNRVAHSTHKNLLIAVVDEEGSVTYYEISWTRP